MNTKRFNFAWRCLFVATVIGLVAGLIVNSSLLLNLGALSGAICYFLFLVRMAFMGDEE